MKFSQLKSTQLTKKIISKWIPRRNSSAHKGNCGRILIVAGSRGMVGAGVLASMGAVKGGAGLVRVATVKSQQIVAAKRAPLEVTTIGFSEDSKGFLSAKAWEELKKAIRNFHPDVIAVGPGLGTSVHVARFVKNILFKLDIPVVLDADGLNVLTARDLEKPRSAPLIITPHPGECGKLFGRTADQINQNRIVWAHRASKEWSCVCVLKGAHTLISSGKGLAVNTTGNSKMASGGMGDVLTGLVAAIWGQNQNFQETGFHSAATAVYLHGLAGDLAAKEAGLSVQASTVAEFIPKALRKILKK